MFQFDVAANLSVLTKYDLSIFNKLPPLPSHILTVNIDGIEYSIDPGKWEQITNMSVFPQLDIIILTEYHLSATFRPAT